MQNDVTFFAAFFARMASCNESMYIAFMGYQSMEIPFKCCLCGVDVSRIRSIGSSHFSIKKDLPLLPFLVPLPTCSLWGGEGQGQHM